MALTEELMALGMPYGLASRIAGGGILNFTNSTTLTCVTGTLSLGFGTGGSVDVLNGGASGGSIGWQFVQNGRLVSNASNGGNLVFTRATTGIEIQSGANGRTGTLTLNGATPVVASNTSLAAADMIILNRDTVAGTPAAFNVTARSNGTSFTVTGTAGDTSVLKYWLVQVN